MVLNPSVGLGGGNLLWEEVVKVNCWDFVGGVVGNLTVEGFKSRMTWFSRLFRGVGMI